MIRLVLVLLLGIGTTMAVFGTDEGLPEGSDAGGPPLAQRDSDGPSLLSRVGELIDDGVAPAETTERVPLADERRAIEIALAATRAPDTADTTTDTVTEAPAQPASQSAAPADPTDMWYVTGTRVNLRSGPSTSDTVVGQVVLGQRAEVIEEAGEGWFRIRTTEDGQDGYIYGQFLSPNRPG